MAGAVDPVGACGEGVREAADLYRSQGVEDVREIIYPNMRHEILNEPRRVDVFTDVEQWFTECVVMNAVVRTREVARPIVVESDEANSQEEVDADASRDAGAGAGYGASGCTDASHNAGSNAGASATVGRDAKVNANATADCNANAGEGAGGTAAESETSKS